MHLPALKQAALALIAAGHNDCEVSRRLGIPRRTIMDWRRPTYVSRREGPVEACPRCWRTTKPVRFENGDYAELLAMYLGDGFISIGARTQRLRITLDLKYPRIIDSTAALVGRCFPENRVDTVVSGVGNWVNVSVYSTHLCCLLPQHGPGKKHEREISLEPWQELVYGAPWAFLRGLVLTDGCSFINRTGRYEYLSYDFSNRSEDIARMFTAACDRVGVRYRLTNQRDRRIWDIRINRRESVALMKRHVGLKT
ncbi:MAG: hypothetical protein QOI10_2351 [Solirubrobacterales bacterium]|jgi:hypothetical protein|nr:hypothetical protein [Solirubrobacterales bacterium]